MAQEDKPFKKIGICIPSRENWKSDFGQSLVMAVADFVLADFKDFQVGVRLINSKGSILPEQRMDMVLGCLEADCTHIMFLDDDMAFPASTISQLLLRDKDIVAANCVMKSVPAKTTAKDLNNKPVYSDETATGLQEVAHVGCAVMLIKAEVFKTIGLPYFDFVFQNEKDGYIGEDVFFCRKAREKGYSVYVDHDLSKSILHIGDYYYHHHLVEKETTSGLIIEN